MHCAPDVLIGELRLIAFLQHLHELLVVITSIYVTLPCTFGQEILYLNLHLCCAGMPITVAMIRTRHQLHKLMDLVNVQPLYQLHRELFMRSWCVVIAVSVYAGYHRYLMHWV